MKKVSMICTTYGRFQCVRRVLAQFRAQTHPNLELIIFNTDEDYPLELGIKDDRIRVINNGIDYKTWIAYTNRGAICRDAVSHASGDYFMLADDDDVYLPWHALQAHEGITRTEKAAWKPEYSFFASNSGISLVKNTMEASVIVKMDRIREIGFRTDLTGYEGLSWYTKLRDEGELDEYNKDYIPSYCFNWSDPPEMAPHKQSGDINNLSNFENHKACSTDHATEKLTPYPEWQLAELYERYYDFIEENPHLINQVYKKRYYK